MTLYEIDQAIIDALEGAIDPETGEVMDDALLASYEKLQEDRDAKIENIGLFIKNLEAEADAVKLEAKKLTARAKASENKAEHLRSYLQWRLAGEKFTTPKLKISYRNSKKVNITDLEALPEEFLRYKEPEPDKTKIKDAIKAGQDVPGAEVVEQTTMQLQ